MIINENKILKLYKTKSACEIAQKFHCSYGVIYKILKKHNITRKPWETNKLTWQKLGDWENKTQLEQLYLNEKLSVSQIAKKFKVRNNAIRLALHRFGIKLRSLSEHMAISENRVRVSEYTKVALASQATRKRISVNSKQMWRTWGYKPPVTLLQAIQSEGYRDKMREITLKRHHTSWHDTIKPLISSGLSRCWKDNKDYRYKITEYARIMFKRLYEDEIFHAKWKKAHLAAMADPEYRAHRSQLVKELWKNGAYRTKMLDARINMPMRSAQQATLYDLLRQLAIRFEPEKRIGYYLFDCYLPDHKILIEVNGDYWHNLPRPVRNDKAKSTYIERYFPDMKLKTIWEHEFKCMERVTALLSYWTKKQPTAVVDFDKITFHEIDKDTANKFIQAYHYLGKIGNNIHRFGFYLDDILIAVIVFGQITRKESAERLKLQTSEVIELTRLCIHPVYQVKNLASYIVSRAIKEIKKVDQYKVILSFADSTFNHYGTVYKASNWKYDGETEPSYWYVDRDGYVMHKKTLWNHARSLKMSESEFAKKYGYSVRHSLAKSRFLYYL